MRTIQEIKTQMQTAFMHEPALAKAYGFEPGDSFSSRFGAASIENLLLYVVAACNYVLEALMDEHRTEVEQLIEEQAVHRPKWYRDKALAFMDNHTLIPDTDRYDTEGMTPQQIEEAHVVRFAAATEDPDTALLTIKVAGEQRGSLCTLSPETMVRLTAYFALIRDAGVRIKLVNKQADDFAATLTVYYDLMLDKQTVHYNCLKAIKAYIGNLPFNGEYTNMSLVDALQAVKGVKVVHFVEASVQVDGEVTRTYIEARHCPAAGYMQADDENLTLNMLPYEQI